MNEQTDETSALNSTASLDVVTTVLVAVGEESAEQVSFAGHVEPQPMRVRAVRGSDLELAGPTFFPKNCQLSIELQDSRGAHAGALKGTVRKLQMLALDPSYVVSVRLTESVPSLVDELRRGALAAEASVEPGLERAIGSSSAPGWAARLVGDGALTAPQLDEMVASALADSKPLDEALVDAGLVLAEKVASCMAMELGVPFVDPDAFEIQRANAALVPEELVRRHDMFPLFNVGGVITLGMSDPSDLAVIDQVRLRASAQVDQCMVLPSAIAPLIERAYGSAAAAALQLDAELKAADDDDPDEASSNEIVRLVRSMVEDSARDGVSDVHIEPERDKMRVRVRLDGILHERSVHPLKQHAPIVSRIKVMAKLDIAETRRPQDGHFSLKSSAGNVDVRVSTLPTVYGENVVLRLLFSDGKAAGLDELGMSEGTLTSLEHFLAQPNGMILVTGPTGSGKTTTLYAALTRLSTIESSVVTVEDPVEKRMPLVRQTEVNVKAGLTFASGLRSILRQDPDVIMIGEIRDHETAEIAVQSALTGHMVLSTLHTNSAAGAIIRLGEIGVPPFLITASLRAVLSQRLARRICEACSESVQPDPQLVAGFGLEDSPEIDYKAGAGCKRCFQTGYQGRVGIYELLPLTNKLSASLLGGASRDVIEREAEAAVTTDLRGDGLRRVREGLTTLEEVARIAGLDLDTSRAARD
jgi:type II secretory ATPase GspE/PulE/Tfp pilus assembly ATPase PilB-like protein